MQGVLDLVLKVSTLSLARGVKQMSTASAFARLRPTGAAAVPFGMHFDAHEVLAVQCEGRKEWRVSSVRVDRPLEGVPPGQALRAETERLRVLAPDQIATTFVAEPGDVVYLPRGQFHSARTPEQRSLHITFGIESVSGRDLLQVLLSIALEEGLFRSYFPAPPADPDGRQAVEQVAALEARLVSIMQRGVFAATRRGGVDFSSLCPRLHCADARFDVLSNQAIPPLMRWNAARGRDRDRDRDRGWQSLRLRVAGFNSLG